MGRATPGSGCSLVASLAWTLQRVPGTTVHHPPPPPGAQGVTLFGNRFSPGEIKLRLAHPG